jgi:hypothetical protein
MIEDWLARRGQADEEDTEGYEKVLEMYSLHVLPRLRQWEYAEEFLEYESELQPERREVCPNLQTSLFNMLIRNAANEIEFAVTAFSISSPSFTTLSSLYTNTFTAFTFLSIAYSFSGPFLIVVLFPFYNFNPYRRPTHSPSKWHLLCRIYNQ